jgi:hypothetical protein
LSNAEARSFDVAHEFLRGRGTYPPPRDGRQYCRILLGSTATARAPEDTFPFRVQAAVGSRAEDCSALPTPIARQRRLALAAAMLKTDRYRVAEIRRGKLERLSLKMLIRFLVRALTP